MQSTVAFFFKAAWVKNNWFWQYKVFSIIILQTAKIDPSGFFHLRLYSAFPMLLGVAAQCHMRSRGSIQKPEEVVQNHNGCLKKMSGFVGLLLVLVFFRVVFGLVLGFLFCFYLKCSVLSLSFEVRKLFRGSLATFTSFLLNQTAWAHPRRGESWSPHGCWSGCQEHQRQLEGSQGLGRMCTLVCHNTATMLHPASGWLTADIPAGTKAEMWWEEPSVQPGVMPLSDVPRLDMGGGGVQAL